MQINSKKVTFVYQLKKSYILVNIQKMILQFVENIKFSNSYQWIIDLGITIGTQVS